MVLVGQDGRRFVYGRRKDEELAGMFTESVTRKVSLKGDLLATRKMLR